MKCKEINPITINIKFAHSPYSNKAKHFITICWCIPDHGTHDPHEKKWSFFALNIKKSKLPMSWYSYPIIHPKRRSFKTLHDEKVCQGNGTHHQGRKQPSKEHGRLQSTHRESKTLQQQQQQNQGGSRSQTRIHTHKQEWSGHGCTWCRWRMRTMDHKKLDVHRRCSQKVIHSLARGRASVKRVVPEK